ncbi:hypothetical protein ACFOUO_10560 [Salinithrix halophila]|uniref:Uncharacterized protein n=1 Tax=Salinithrix halophila TaxID=1485204 RepID=A0ABV8JFK3_9BACL
MKVGRFSGQRLLAPNPNEVLGGSNRFAATDDFLWPLFGYVDGADKPEICERNICHGV